MPLNKSKGWYCASMDGFLSRHFFFPVKHKQATASMKQIYTDKKSKKKKNKHKYSIENSTTSDVAVLWDLFAWFCLFGVVYSIPSVYIIYTHYIYYSYGTETFDR